MTKEKEMGRIIIENDHKYYATTIKPSESQWLVNGNTFSFVGHTVKELPAGYYKIIYDQRDGTNKFMLVDPEGDDLLILPHEVMSKIIKDVESFWQKEEKYAKYKFLYKRGILLYGEPGCGKSSIISLLAQKIISNHNGVVISIDNLDAIYGLFKVIGKLSYIEEGRKL